MKRKFISQSADIFNSVIDNDLSIDDLEDVKMCRLSTIVTAIELLPIKLVGDKMKSFFVQVLPTLSYAIFTDKEDFDYELIQRIISKICPMILSSDKSDIDIYIKPLMDSFQFGEHSYLFLFHFIYVEDRSPQYENFWYLWDLFLEKIADLIDKMDGDRTATRTIKCYLLPIHFGPKATEWHSVREKEASFYDRVVDMMGHEPIVLYSIAKILNDIGSRFQSRGLTWLSDMISTHNYNDLEPDTIYYMETFIRRFIILNKQRIRTDRMLKGKVLSILDFLFENGSTIGFLLREDIL